MTDPETKILLEDMLAHARAASEFMEGLTLEEFCADRKSVFATTRAVEVVGEAASQIAAPSRAVFASLPWRQSIDMRNRLIHGYRKLDPIILYKTVKEDFPFLIAELTRILNESPTNGR
mgnify:CR=1 FL=1